MFWSWRFHHVKVHSIEGKPAADSRAAEVAKRTVCIQKGESTSVGGDVDIKNTFTRFSYKLWTKPSFLSAENTENFQLNDSEVCRACNNLLWFFFSSFFRVFCPKVFLERIFEKKKATIRMFTMLRHEIWSRTPCCGIELLCLLDSVRACVNKRENICNQVINLSISTFSLSPVFSLFEHEFEPSKLWVCQNE